jgi:hypothetical protein
MDSIPVYKRIQVRKRPLLYYEVTLQVKKKYRILLEHIGRALTYICQGRLPNVSGV